ncbi:MAG: DVUA0089 family protein [Sedimenticola sp.]
MKKLACLIVCMLAGTAQATTVAEIGDAGDLMGSAQVLGAGTTAITGSGGSGDIDLYSFGWSGGSFTASTSASIDPQLFLFNSSGYGILADDDSAGGLNSLISLTLAAGNYFLAINGYNNEATSISGNIFNNGCCGTELPTGPGAGDPLSGWTGGGSAGTYTISFRSATSAVVPEPASLALMGLGLAGLGYSRKKKASS